MESFDAVIEGGDRGGAGVQVPEAVVAALGGGGRIPVQATFDGVAYQGSIVTMGGTKMLGMLKAIRDHLGKGPGDVVKVTVEIDRAERSVVVPDDLRRALDQAGLTDAFDHLSYSHRREHVRAVEEAKRPETRRRRIERAIDQLRS